MHLWTSDSVKTDAKQKKKICSHIGIFSLHFGHVSMEYIICQFGPNSLHNSDDFQNLCLELLLMLI